MKVLTANRLTDGIAVWFTGGQKWAETFEPALIAHDDDGIAAFEAESARAQAAQQIVDVAIIDVITLEGGGYVPQRLRERVRAAGPTNRQDLGKQAELDVPVADTLPTQAPQKVA